MGWVIACGIIVLLSLLPLGILATYNDGGADVFLTAGFLRIRLYPKKKKAAPNPAQTSSNAGFEKKKTAGSKGGKLTDFLPLLKELLDFLVTFQRKLCVRELILKVTLAGGDPCDLAINYGKAWAALGNLMPRLEQFFRIKKRDLQVQCDFTAEQTLVDARVHLTITLGRLLCIFPHHGVRIFKKFIIISNQRKGGADNS